MEGSGTLPDVRAVARLTLEHPRLTTVDPAHYVRGAEVARGGMGRVIRAYDRRLGREVALKELILEGDAARARFEREARITASLQHPSIIHVHEAGLWPDGSPFFAMNFVDGHSLSDVIRGANTLAERLALVRNIRDVADAMAYAHARGLVHRDLKPANILVGGFGETIVIDWGLAMDSGPDAEAGVAGTPRYMPPEQARGEPVDARADVYAIGAMLYHALAGTPPYEDSEAVVDAVIAGPPKSLRVVVREAPRDLASIVDKAMARDAGDRYTTAAGLVEDLQRFEMGRLVGARHYSIGQRAWRFLRVHTLVLTLGALLLVVGAVSLLRIFAASAEAREQAARAQRRFSDVRQLANSLVVDIDTMIRDIPGTVKARELLVERAVQYLDTLARDRVHDPALDRELAHAYMRIGDIQGNVYEPNIGKIDDALGSLAAAQRLLDRARGRDPDPVAWAAAQVRLDLGVAFAHRYQRDHGSVRAYVLRAFARAYDVPMVRLDRIAMIRGYITMSLTESDAYAFPEARRWVAKGLAYLESWPDRDGAETRYWHAVMREARAAIALRDGDADGVVADARAALAILEKLVAEHPMQQQYAREVSFSMYMLFATYLGKEGTRLWLPGLNERDAAEASARDRCGRVETMLARTPGDTRSIISLGSCLIDLAVAVTDRSPVEGLEIFERASGVFSRLDPEPRRSGHVREFENLYHCMQAVSLAELHRRDEAREQARLGRANAAYDPLIAAMCESRIARMHEALGETEDAARVLEGVLSVVRGRTDLNSRIGTVETLRELARLTPAHRCTLLREALLAWRAIPLETSYGRRVDSELELQARCSP